MPVQRSIALLAPLITDESLGGDIGVSLPRYTTDNPCLALVRATLEDAFYCRMHQNITNRRQAKKDVQWILSESEGLFSFVWCCAVLGLQPAIIRQRYLALIPKTRP
jgi:hypothetical protein